MTDTSSPARRAGMSARKRKPPSRWTKRRKQTFLAALAETANVRRSVEQANMSISSVYDLKARDPDFAAAWRAALEAGYSEVEMALMRQSIEGSDRIETMVVDGKVKYVKTTRSFPFPAAMRLLLAHRDEVQAFRQARDGAEDEEDEEAVGARVKAYMDLIRGRLIAQGVVSPDNAIGDEDGEGDGYADTDADAD